MSIREIRDLLMDEGERRRLGLLAVVRALDDDWQSRSNLLELPGHDSKADAGDRIL